MLFGHLQSAEIYTIISCTMPDALDAGAGEHVMIDDTRRHFWLNADGSVEAKLDVVVCGQTATIQASVDVIERVINDGGGHRIIREPAQSDAIKKANALLDEKLAASKLALGEAA